MVAPITSGNYSYCSDGFKISKVPRSSPSQLHEYFNSPDTRTLMHTRRWAAAQLQHYGFAERGGSRPSVMAALEREVVSGKCDSVPARMVAIEEDMKNRYDSAVTEAAIRKEAALRRREAALAERLRKQEADLADEAKRREQAFLAETDPVEAACIDFDRFLCRYFLDATGKVDVKKAPQVLVLHGLSDPQAALTSAEKYDGVHTQIGGLDDYPPERNHVLVIGCDYQSVYSEAMKITKRHESELEDERDWISEVRLAGHEEFVKQNGEKKQEPSGAYTVICYEIEGNWPDRGSDGLTLDIGPDRERKGELVAQFAWDVVLAGMMRFYKDGEQPEDVDTDEEVRGSRKRKRSNKRPTEEAQPKKKRPNEKSQPDPFKLHFTWQGIEGGEGEVLESDRNRGWIRFLNENYLQFEGEISNSCLGPNVKFSGYKFSTNPEITTRWGGYAAHVYRRYWDEDRRL